MRSSPSPFRLLISIPLIVVLSACSPVAPKGTESTPMIPAPSPVISIAPTATAVSKDTAEPVLRMATTTPTEGLVGKPPPETVFLESTPTPSPSTEATSGTMKVSLDIQGRIAEVILKEGSSTYDLLVAAQKQGLTTFSGRQFSGVGYFVESINGLQQDGNKGMYWIYSVNGKKANVGVSSYVLRTGDRVTFTYEAASE